MELVSVGINHGFEDESTTNFSSATTKKNYAITIRHAHTHYTDVLKYISSRRAPTSNVVLNNFNMTVEKGHIYALLGASGCGKTTILRAIIGRHNLTSGEILVLGQLVGSKHNGRTTTSSTISGASIGYMPQEVSLLEKFTIKETFCYYGQLVGMTEEKIKVETNKLARILDLPSVKRNVGTLSGGQQRRISFAVALLHNPPLLILDEPTVGLDPLLRESIWRYLKTVFQKTGTTIVITTHYTAEANQADTVGLIRHGTLMAEQSPHTLIQSLGCLDLEEVIVKLSLLQSTNHRLISTVGDSQEQIALPPVNDSDVTFESENAAKNEVPPYIRIWALIWKGLIWLARNRTYTLSLVLMPVIIISGVFFVTREPTGMHISVFNQDSNCYFEGNERRNLYNQIFNCSTPANLSCEILSYLKSKGIIAVTSGSEESAEEYVRLGKSWAAITFSRNFSSALMERLQYTSLLHVTEEMVDMGSIRVALDQSDRIISFSIQAELLKAIFKLLSDFDDVCHTIKHMKKMPIQYFPPVYGYFETSNTDYVYPSVITAPKLLLALLIGIPNIRAYFKVIKLEWTIFGSFAYQIRLRRPNMAEQNFIAHTVFYFSHFGVASTVTASLVSMFRLTFVLPLTATLCALLPEKLEGTLERSMVSGVTTLEIMVANMVVYVPFTIAQIFILLLIPYKVLHFYFAGSIWTSALLLFYLGINGMILGIITALVSSSVSAGASFAMGLYFIFLFTGGLAWPLDGVVSPVRELCYAMPLTYPSEALRHISQRGWSLLHRTPQLALLSTTIWTVIFLVVLIILLRMKAF